MWSGLKDKASFRSQTAYQNNGFSLPFCPLRLGRGLKFFKNQPLEKSGEKSMNSISNINFTSPSAVPPPDGTVSSQAQSAAASFTAILNQLTQHQHSHSSSGGGSAGGASQAQDQTSELEQEYIFLSSMVDQSRQAMTTQQPLPGQTSTPAGQAYFYWLSQLSALQVQNESQGL